MRAALCESRRPTLENKDMRGDYANEAARVGEWMHGCQLMRMKTAGIEGLRVRLCE